MTYKNDFLIVVPFFNEESTLKNLHKDLFFFKKNLIFINDNSSDNGVNYLTKFKILNNKKNIGYEKSLLKGFKYAKENNFKYVISFDADNQHRVSDLKKIIRLLKKDNYDLIIGNRNFYNRLVEYFINYFFYKKYEIKDILSGLKAYNLKLMNLHPKNYLNNTSGMKFVLTFLLNENIKLYQYQIFVRKRKGKSTFGGFIKGNYILIKSFVNSL